MKSKKKEKYPRRIVYYDAYTDDFEAEADGARAVDSNYRYIRNSVFFKAMSFVAHNIIAPPFAFGYSRLFLREKYIGKHKLKGQGGYVIYANHAEPVGDALCPHTVTFPKKTYTVVHPDNVALPVIGKLIPYLGAIPTPIGLRGARHFSECIKTRLDEGSAIVIFPEAHVWKKYTGIRPFSEASFEFPVKYSCPAFSFTRTYRRMPLFGYRCCIYIDGPFYQDESLPRASARAKLMDEIHTVMSERSRLSDVEIIRYIRKEK